MRKLLKYIIPAVLVGLAVAGISHAVSVFNSNQVGSSPTSGAVLQTNGATSTWSTLVAGTNVTINTSTLGQITFSATGGGGAGTISTSSAATIGRVPYWTSLSQLAGTSPFITDGTITGVNATSSTTTFLVQGNAGVNPFSITSSTGTTLLTVTQAGNLGVGTSTPNLVNGIALPATRKIFQLENGADAAQFIVAGKGTSNIPGGIFEFLDYNGPTNGKWFSLQNKGGITTAKTVTDNGNTGTVMQSWDLVNNRVGIATDTPSTTLFVQGIGGTNPFAVASSTGTQLLTVTQAGNVGIGTTTPPYALSVVSSAAAPTALFSCSNTTFGCQFILDATPAGGRDYRFFSSGSSNAIGGGKTGIYDGTAGAYRLVMDSSGNVGIGTSTPSSKLHVYGSAAIDPFTVASSSFATLFTVKASGNVGIGSSSPSSLLTVQGTSTTQPSILQIGGNTNPGCLALNDWGTSAPIYVKFTNGVMGTSTSASFCQ